MTLSLSMLPCTYRGLINLKIWISSVYLYITLPTPGNCKTITSKEHYAIIFVSFVARKKRFESLNKSVYIGWPKNQLNERKEVCKQVLNCLTTYLTQKKIVQTEILDVHHTNYNNFQPLIKAFHPKYITLIQAFHLKYVKMFSVN
jgi:hypothetical protein